MPWLIVVVLIAFLIWYAMAGRQWLKTTAWGARFLNWIEPLEITLYKKSETLLVGRLTWLGSAIVAINDAIAVMAPSLDWTPITSRLVAPIPQDLRGVAVTLGVGVFGLIINWLRKRTAKPVALVAAPTTPETEAVEAKVEAMNAEAVAVSAAATK